MSFGFGLGDIALILQTCTAIYNKFKEADETITNAHERIETIHNYVKTVIKGLDSQFGSRATYPKSEPCHLIVQKMNFKAKEVKKIFQKYREIQLQPNFVSLGWYQLLYVCGSSTHDLQILISGLETHKNDLAHELSALTAFNILHSQNQLLAQQTLSAPKTPKPDVDILFLDALNTGRSVVAQAYALLVAEWTKRTNGQWKIRTIHSAGIDVKNQCGLIDVRQQFPDKLYEGNGLPSLSAQAALFDKPYFNYPYKAVIRENISKHRSRGLGSTTFNRYDYIFVFTLNGLWKIQKLLSETRKKYPNLVTKGKSKFVVLGEYGNSRNGSNIWGPDDGLSEHQKKEYWNRTVANIKVSLKGWLTKELNWKQPPKGAPQN